jgi:hypothetical protein
MEKVVHLSEIFKIIFYLKKFGAKEDPFSIEPNMKEFEIKLDSFQS